MQPEDAGDPMDRALLIGVSDYRWTDPPHGVPGKLEAVRNNVPVLRRALVRAGVFADGDIVPLCSPDFAEAARELQRVARRPAGCCWSTSRGTGRSPAGATSCICSCATPRCSPASTRCSTPPCRSAT
ncbi:hypothetical protein ACFQV4_01895 [Streptomyces thermocarboxydus]